MRDRELEIFELWQAADELARYLDDILDEEVDRDIVLGLAHNVSEAYVALAAKLDNAKFEVVD